MATTAKGIPYPEGTDDNRITDWFQDLAEWLDAALGGLSQAQIDALAGGALWAGRRVFNTTTKMEQVYNGTHWKLPLPPGFVLWMASADSAVLPGCVRADGAAYARVGQYAALYAAVGTLHGVGDNSTTFNVPNLNGRMVCGFTAAQTQFNVVGKTGGAVSVTIAIANMPSHNHTGPSHQHTTPDHAHTTPAHQHGMNHQHPAGNTTGAGTHAHTFDNARSVWAQKGSGGEQGLSILNPPVAQDAGFVSATEDAGSHQHSFTTPNYVGVTSLGGAGNTGPSGTGVTGAAGTGVTGNTGGGTALTILNPYVTLVPYVVY